MIITVIETNMVTKIIILLLLLIGGKKATATIEQQEFDSIRRYFLTFIRQII